MRTLRMPSPGPILAAMPDQLDTVFSALADPTRRRILTMLLEDDMAVTDVAEPFEMSLAAISKHLRILTRSGLVAQEKRGRVTWCKLEPDALRAASTSFRRSHSATIVSATPPSTSAGGPP